MTTTGMISSVRNADVSNPPTIGAALGFGLATLSLYVTFPGRSLMMCELFAQLVLLGGIAGYLINRPEASRMIWPAVTTAP